MAHSSPITATSPTSCPAASWASTRGNSGPTGAGSVGQTRPGTSMSRWTMPTSPAFGRTRARLPRITGLILGLSLSSPAPAQLQGLMGAILVTQVSALTVSCLASEPLSQLPPPPPPAPPPPPPPPPREQKHTPLPAGFLLRGFHRGTDPLGAPPTRGPGWGRGPFSAPPPH